MNALFDQLLVLARAKSTLRQAPVSQRQPVDDMRRRYKYLEKADLLTVVSQQSGSMTFLLSGDPDVLLTKQSRVVDPNVSRPRKQSGWRKFFGATNIRPV
jgi:hypothetical protein